MQLPELAKRGNYDISRLFRPLSNRIWREPYHVVGNVPAISNNRVHRQIEDYILSKNNAYNFDTCKDYQKQAVLDAEIYQAFYIFHSVDFSTLSGYDTATGALVDKNTILERELCEQSVKTLKLARLLYRIYGVPQ